MSISDRLGQIEDRADAATEAPWEWEATNPTMTGANWNLRIAGRPGIRLAVSEYQHGPANAEFIAHARTDVPALVAALHAILDLHEGAPNSVSALYPDPACNECGQTMPCPTVRAVEATLGEVQP